MSELAPLLDLVPHPLIEVVVRGSRHEVLHLNPAACELYGYASDELAGRDFSTLTATPPAELDERYAELRRYGRWRGPTVHLARDGSRLDVDIAVSPSPQGLDRYVIAVTDLTRQRALQRRLQEQSMLLDLAPVAIVVRDVRRRITYWSRGAEQMYGFTAAEVLGRQIPRVLETEYPIPLEQIERAVEHEGAWEGELVQRTRDGRRIVVDSRWGAVRDERGRLTAMLEVNHDASARLALRDAQSAAAAAAERERLSARLVRAQRLESLGELAGGIAHDFNNLLAVVAGYATTLSDTLDDVAAMLPEAVRSSLRADTEGIAAATQRAAELTRQLLTFARQDSVASDLVSLNDVIEDLEPLLSRTIGEHIRLELHLDRSLAPIRADAGQLGQVLVNLAVNARDAMPDGGRLLIETSSLSLDRDPDRPEQRPGDYAQLTVTDTGCGMEPEVLERAFDPFFTTKPPGTGTGLGLSGVYGIVTAFGGHAALYSEPGHGTTFRARFPAETRAAAPGAQPDAASTGASVAGAAAADGATVLVVEDQEPLRAITARILERAGYRVLTASSGPEALRRAAEAQRIDLLLTDVVMPDMLGQRLAELIRELRPGLRVVFVSGFARPALEQAGRALEGPLLHKPFTSAELLGVVARALGVD
ncbi:MAG TPA: PAS domain S-box protein [Solirubrobacteraceae bacterium]|nr:PAS domain S-box protein [Solirubrobacteraceae bacterium]